MENVQRKLTLCKSCEVCQDKEYTRKGHNGETQSFLYCNGGAEEVQLANWYIQNDGYPYSTSKIKGKRRLYHTLFKEEEGQVIDHINGDRRDNRLRNLREVTPLMNTHNYHNKRTSDFPGVYYNRKYGTWHAVLRQYSEKNPNHKRVSKSFKNEFEAFDWYLQQLKEQGREPLTDAPYWGRYLKWKSEQQQSTLEAFI